MVPCLFLECHWLERDRRKRFCRKISNGHHCKYFYSGGKTKVDEPNFPYKIGIFKSSFRDKNVGILLKTKDFLPGSYSFRAKSRII